MDTRQSLLQGLVEEALLVAESMQAAKKDKFQEKARDIVSKEEQSTPLQILFMKTIWLIQP